MRPKTEKTRADDGLAWEVQAVLAWHDEDAMAAIRTLLLDCRHLRGQLALAEGLISSGMGRGWRPSFERD